MGILILLSIAALITDIPILFSKIPVTKNHSRLLLTNPDRDAPSFKSWRFLVCRFWWRIGRQRPWRCLLEKYFIVSNKSICTGTIMNLNRKDFQNLTVTRIKEAKVLLDNGKYEGAYYLAGYAVECALKSCIAKNTKRYEFPPKNCQNYYDHNLKKLIGFANLSVEFDKKYKADSKFQLNWETVKGWNSESRYQTTIQPQTSLDFYKAITDRKSGVLKWIKTLW